MFLIRKRFKNITYLSTRFEPCLSLSRSLLKSTLTSNNMCVYINIEKMFGKMKLFLNFFQGPFDGILAFSQGATFAAHICALREQPGIFKYTFIDYFISTFY